VPASPAVPTSPFLPSQENSAFGGAPVNCVAETCTLSGTNQETIHYLREDFKKHDPRIVDIRHHTALRGLHDDPAFRDLVSRIELPLP
jgi:hypothetical protein